MSCFEIGAIDMVQQRFETEYAHWLEVYTASFATVAVRSGRKAAPQVSLATTTSTVVSGTQTTHVTGLRFSPDCRASPIG